MANFRFNIAARLLIATSVLLVNGRTPAVCHAHAEGDRPHDHRNSKPHDHDHAHPHHSHSHAHHAPHRVPHGDSSSTSCHCTNSTRHLHFSWFGVEFTLPAPPVENESSDPFNSTEIAIVRAVDGPAMVKSNEASAGPDLGALFSVPISQISFAPAVRLQHANTTATLILLCDAARHERSGVQLS